jgi:translation initiation factor 5
VDIYVKAKELGIEAKHKTLTVLAQTIFDEDIVKQIPVRAPMLKKVCTESTMLCLPQQILTFSRR